VTYDESIMPLRRLFDRVYFIRRRVVVLWLCTNRMMTRMPLLKNVGSMLH